MSDKKYPISGSVWFRESTQEWVLELEGSINGTYFIYRYPEPSTTLPEDVPGLPSLYHAADRIQALEDKLAENEVRLRKAVEGLEDIVKDCEADYPPSHGAIKHFAIATLAEISSHNKGESRDVPDR